MTIRNFRLNIVLRILLILGNAFLLLVSILYTEFYATTVGVGLLLVYQVYSLIKYVEQTNRLLTRFFDSIQYSDFSQSFAPRGLGRSFDELYASFAKVMDEFKRARQEKEESFRYLQTVVQHIGVGLITFDVNGDVILLNNAAKKLLDITTLKNISGLAAVDEGLVQKLFGLKGGERLLVKVMQKNELVQLSMHAVEFRQQNQKYTLVSFSDIHSELEEKEMEAWQNLIRVLTHEIMNSVTPISSLASTLNGLLEQGEPDEDMHDDLKVAMQTIQKRSEGLIHFVNNYRNLTRIPKPEFEKVHLAEFFKQINHLMEQQIDEAGVNFSCRVVPDDLEVVFDPRLIEQVLINLIMNAVHATKGRPDASVRLEAHIDERSRPLLTVSDNGIGIPRDVQEKIFIPFYTTKQDGSGIGLSLSRQIMRQHKGNIQVHSEKNEGCTFTLLF